MVQKLAFSENLKNLIRWYYLDGRVAQLVRARDS